MGVYIKNMEMPENCLECPLVVCLSVESDCPLVPVPPHGDLIDRDALKKDCKENAKMGIGLWVDYTGISLAPTIIPADKESGE